LKKELQNKEAPFSKFIYIYLNNLNEIKNDYLVKYFNRNDKY